MRAFCVGVSMFLFSGIALAEDAPNLGMVYNTKGDNALSYECAHSGDRLECEFLQTSVRRKLEPGEVQGRLEQFRKSYGQAVAEMSKDETCGKVAEWLAVIKGEASEETLLAKLPTADDKTEMQAAIAKAKSDLQEYPDEIEMFARMLTFCSDRTEESFLAMNQELLDRDAHTCNVSSYRFKQTFVRVDDAWVVEAKPEGPCGVVNLSRFVKDKSSSVASYSFWRYYSRKTVTNPEGQMLSERCDAAFDTKEYKFDWKKSVRRKDCTYIDFSPI